MQMPALGRPLPGVPVGAEKKKAGPPPPLGFPTQQFTEVSVLCGSAPCGVKCVGRLTAHYNIHCITTHIFQPHQLLCVSV